MSFSSSFVVMCFGLALLNVFSVDATPLTDVTYTANAAYNSVLPEVNGVLPNSAYKNGLTTNNGLVDAASNKNYLDTGIDSVTKNTAYSSSVTTIDNEPLLAVRSPGVLDAMMYDTSKLMGDMDSYAKAKTYNML
ncbi:uncharacterized protein LOC126847932 [Adelges cooleyi]|uniref:uncharacterized protein LOC126847932 n=1 Tax=Adelges cooleyi TaxID=133065 RepID=UPI002180059D|nr:uncharacterized protein LOC126847932 [Adelges cooleyi]